MNHEDAEGFLSAAGWDKPIKRANNPMDETDFYDHITQGPRSNPKKCITLHPTVRGECLYLLSGEVIGVERVVETEGFNRREQSRVHVAGASFLVKETAEEVLKMLSWTVE